MNLTLRACPSPAFALPLPCLCPAFAGRQAAGRECFYNEATNVQRISKQSIYYYSVKLRITFPTCQSVNTQARAKSLR